MIIAIDGPAGAGKSSIAKKCAEAFSLLYINSGLLYRIIALKVIGDRDDEQIQISAGDMRSPSGNERQTDGTPPELSTMRQNLAERTVSNTTPAQLADDYQRYTRTPRLYGRCYSAAIDAHVGQISAIVSVRQLVNQAISLLEQNRDCITEGRDIASVVHRDADLKIYLNADIEIRARRRMHQRADSEENYHTVLHSMRARDIIDRQKEVGKLIVSKDSVEIDTTYLTFLEVYAIVNKCIAKMLSEYNHE